MHSSQVFILFTCIRTKSKKKYKSKVSNGFWWERGTVYPVPLWSPEPSFLFSRCPLWIKGHLHHPRNNASGFVLANTEAIVCLAVDLRLEVAVCHIKTLGTNVEQLKRSVADCATYPYFNHSVTLFHFLYL